MASTFPTSTFPTSTFPTSTFPTTSTRAGDTAPPTVVLIAPPLTKACEPLLGVSTLAPWLEARGVRCECIDANAEAQAWLVDGERIDALVGAAGGRAPDARLASWRPLRTRVDRLARDLRGGAAYTSFDRYRTTVTSLNRAVGIAGAAHSPAIRATLANYEDERYCEMDSASVLEAARHPDHNLFHAWFRDHLIPRLVALRPTVVGLSLIFRSQLLCGAVLARMVREALPDTHVTLGGELVSAWADRAERTSLMELADSILPYEGEVGLLALAREVASGRPQLHAVPNLLWCDSDGTFQRNATQKVATLAELPAPDHRWAPWDLYFASVRTAPMVTARGCYWNRCTFCPEVVNPETVLRIASVERLTADMDLVHEATGATHFHFIDSALPPSTLKGIARFVRDGRRPYTWYGFCRLERSLVAAAELLAAGGCRMLKLGLESGSQRLLDGMDKRQSLPDVSRLLRALRSAGVMVHAFLMFGTPREALADAQQTLRFVAEHADCIQFMNCSVMNLAHGSPMALDPPAHGIHNVEPFEIPGRTLDLALYSNFEGEGWGRLEARRFLHREFLRDPRIRPAHLRTPALFDSNHSAHLHPLVFPAGPAVAGTVSRATARR